VQLQVVKECISDNVILRITTTPSSSPGSIRFGDDPGQLQRSKYRLTVRKDAARTAVADMLAVVHDALWPVGSKALSSSG